jgi:aspartyl-tRNA(Asn)/glutamyl-tRNA(Gln) amidotransferase subunit B
MADLPYRIVIGLEVHVQLLTKTKLFCGCSTRFGLPPNTAVCPVCLGLPGVLPVMNQHAFELALRAAVALNCKIASFTKWDRKNYYYPDLPKNYQISQYDMPFSHDGYLEIETSAGVKRIGIIRAHLEEDAGKMLHDEHGGGKDSLVDFNRAGTPLLEIVSQPDLSSPDEAKAYLEEMRLLLREIGVSDCEMQEGSLRCDANVNLHVTQLDGGIAATPITEIKNLNSIRAVGKSLEVEAERQYRQFLDNGKKLGEVPKETWGWDETRGVTYFQRRKEESSDYRYFPEPDLVPIVVDSTMLAKTRAEIGELPAQQRKRLVEQYTLSEYDAGVLTRQGRALVAYFEEVVRIGSDAKGAANWVTNQVLATLHENNLEIGQFKLSAGMLADLICVVRETGMNAQRSREVYAWLLEKAGSVKEAMDALDIHPVGDETALREIVARAVAANPKAVADFKKGKTNAANAIKGAVMRETRGMANMELVQRLVLEAMQNA